MSWTLLSRLRVRRKIYSAMLAVQHSYSLNPHNTKYPVIIQKQINSTRGFRSICKYSQSQSQSHSYFTTGSLPPVSSSWRQAPWDSRLKPCGYSPYVTYSLTRAWVFCLKLLAGPRQRSHSHIRVPRDSWPHYTVSDSRLPQPGGPGPCIYISQEQGGPVIPLGTGFPFHLIFVFAGLRWRYSTPPRQGTCKYRRYKEGDVCFVQDVWDELWPFKWILFNILFLYLLQNILIRKSILCF
jgi:hypothetical protein